ncbi:MAG TPA: hypothetical protein VMU85_08010 [Stellaceae bacterium]|nr:hypothetical protein [Stellaceae bacterium]
MGVSPLSRPKSKRRLGVAGAALALLIALGGVATPAAAADGRADSPYWGHRPYPPMAVYPPPPPGYYPPPAPRYNPREAAACDNSGLVAGAMVGAAAGGILAAQASRGAYDNTGATLFGILAGAVIGGAIGQSADQANGCR